MISRTFIDTNVLIYAHDQDAGAKHSRAAGLLAQLWRERSGVVSTQILQEFYVNATVKLPAPLPRAQARRVVQAYSPWCVAITGEHVLDAFRIEDTAHIAFWDALIIAAAARAGAARLLTEDLKSGQVIAGILIENPFTAQLP